MARLLAGGRAPSGKGRALASIATATVIAVGPRSRLVEAAVALRAHAQRVAIRAILIAERRGDEPARPRDRHGDRDRGAAHPVRQQRRRRTAAAEPAGPRLVARRRSGSASRTSPASPIGWCSIPSIPAPVWALVDTLVKEAPVSDLRWTALTRWRALMAHFFDLPGVAAAATEFTRAAREGRAIVPRRGCSPGWLGSASAWPAAGKDYRRGAGQQCRWRR